MQRYYDFSTGLDKSEFFYCYSPQAKARIELECDGCCLKNGFNESTGDYDYLTAITYKKYGCGTVISAECDFDHFGAPMLVITNDIWESDGSKLLGLHFEVVAYNDGCNVWHIERDDSSARGIKAKKIMHDGFKISDGELVKMTVRILEGELLININGHSSAVRCENFPRQFYVGFTAGEGVNRFYNFSVSEE